MQSDHSQPSGLKQKLAHEGRRLMMIFLYFAIFFLVFRTYNRLVLSQYEIDYFDDGLTVLKALVLAKIVLTAEALRFGERFREHPLIIPTLYSTLVFCAFALVFEVLQHLIIGMCRGRSPSEVISELLDKGW